MNLLLNEAFVVDLCKFILIMARFLHENIELTLFGDKSPDI